LIDLTNPSELPKNLAKPGGLWRLRWLAARLTALSGLDCCCFHYTQLKRNSLDKPFVKAIILRPPSPAGMLKCEEAKQELWAMVRESNIPIIAFCGGFHQAYLAYGGKCADMRRLNPGETDPNPKYAPGRLKEWGFTKVKVVKKDPLFEGLGDELDMLEQHVSECRELPPDFELLASTDVCRVQAIKHKTKLLYATQFHPEAYEEGHMDGKRLLQNFFKIAGVSGNISR
jgi:GMP synthase-like glutamine amidotransferase